MKVTGRRVRFAAVLAGVVLALTGFSSSGGHGSSGSGSGKSKGSGGGGCSSSKSKPKKKSLGNGGNGSSSNGSGSTATAAPTATAQPAHAEVVTCAGPGSPKATVKVTSDSSAERTVRTSLTFVWATGSEPHTVELKLKAGESRSVDVELAQADKAGEVQRCTLGPVVTVSTSSPTPTATSGSGSTSKPQPKPTKKKTG